MKLSSGKVAVLEMDKPPVGAGTFCPSPMLAFYIPQCRKCLAAWRNVKYSMGEGQDVPAPTGGLTIPRTAIFQRRASLFIFCINRTGQDSLRNIRNHRKSSVLDHVFTPA
jgi:hypothetical protein